MQQTHSVSLMLVTYLILALVWPTLRTWRRTGVFPVVFQREADPFQRLVGALMALLMALLAVWCVLLGVGGLPLGVWPVPLWLEIPAWGLSGLGALLTMLAQRTMGRSWRVGIDDRATPLVTAGLFGWVRNPIFTGMIASLAGVVLLAPSPWSIAGFVWALSLISLQTRLEEQHLVALHGDAYRAYAERTGRFLPGLGRLSGRPSPPARAAPCAARSERPQA